MSPQAVRVALVAAGMWGVTFALGGVLACAGGPPLPSAAQAQAAAEQAEIAAYAAEQQECVAKAADRGAADVCIMAVRAHWCGDGGALAARGDCPAQVEARAMAQTAAAQGVVEALVGDAGGER